MKAKLRRTRIVALVCIAVLCGSIISITGALTVRAEDAPFTIEQVKDECERYTKKDVLEGAMPYENGKIPELKDYIENINSNYYYPDDKRAL